MCHVDIEAFQEIHDEKMITDLIDFLSKSDNEDIINTAHFKHKLSILKIALEDVLKE